MFESRNQDNMIIDVMLRMRASPYRRNLNINSVFCRIEMRVFVFRQSLSPVIVGETTDFSRLEDVIFPPPVLLVLIR